MTQRNRAEGAIEVSCDFEGCEESYVQMSFGPDPEGWTTVQPPGVTDPTLAEHCCPVHEPSGSAA
jgi:hypothetical protein